MLALGACSSDKVTDAVVVSAVEVSPRLSTARVGTTQQLTAVAKDSKGTPMSGETFTWTSSEPTVATVNASGVVTFVGAGSTAILATSRGTSGFATIMSDANVAVVAMSSATVNVGLGQSVQLTATPQDAKGNALFRPVTWTSSAPTVATVSASGLVTSVSAGTTTITATSESKVGSTAVTIVPPPPVATVALSPNSGFMPTTVGVPLTITLRDAANVLLTDGRIVTYTSSNAAVATVSATGVVTGVAPGAVTVTATSEGKSATASFNVRTGVKHNTPLTFSNSTTSATQFAIYVPAGSTSLKVTLGSGTGDPDLYLYKPGNTNTAADDCHSFNDGPTESCTVTNPAAGVWWVLIDPYVAHVGTIITATIVPTPP